MSVRRFRVTVNGRTFEVEVEEIGGDAGAKVVRSRTSRAPQAPTAPGSFPISFDGKVHAPIPGKVLSIDVTVGDEVKMGDRLLVLESMKIENPILAPRDGRVEQVHVAPGAQVRTGAPLVTIA